MSTGAILPARRIAGNLDCEADFAALADRELGGRQQQRPAGPLSRRVLATITGAATLLRAFARDGDRLWLPAPLARERMADVPGLPRPLLETGPLAGLEPAAEILAWGETPAVAHHRLRANRAHRATESAGRASEGACHAVDGAGHTPVQELPWRLPAPVPAAAAAVNDRRFSLELTGKLGCRLPGARPVGSPGELEAHLETTGTRRWVLKAPFSAAGRRRVIHLGGAVEALTRRRVERLFAGHGELVFEPWIDRTADLGCAAALTRDGLLTVSLHRLLVDGYGRFRGIEVSAGAQGLEGPWLEAEERSRLEQVLDVVAAALRQAGYTGPFGIDAWRHRLPGGGETLHPLGEINARLTFGWVARALVDRVREPLAIGAECRVRLMFGTQQGETQAVRIVPLLRSADETPASPGALQAWLEILDPS